LSSIQQVKEVPNAVQIAKISAKINTLQDVNITLFVRSLSLTS